MVEKSPFSSLLSAIQHFLQAMKISGETRSVPNISWDTATEIIKQIQKIPVENILEIGPANGFSTLMFHIGCPEAYITSIEFSRHAFEELRYNLKTFIQLQK